MGGQEDGNKRRRKLKEIERAGNLRSLSFDGTSGEEIVGARTYVFGRFHDSPRRSHLPTEAIWMAESLKSGGKLGFCACMLKKYSPSPDACSKS